MTEDEYRAIFRDYCAHMKKQGYRLVLTEGESSRITLVRRDGSEAFTLWRNQAPEAAPFEHLHGEMVQIVREIFEVDA